MKFKNGMRIILLGLGTAFLTLIVNAVFAQSTPQPSELTATVTPFLARVGNLAVSQEHVAVQGQYAYVLDWAKRIRVVDLTNIAEPTIVGVGTYHDDCYAGTHCFPWYPGYGRLVVSDTFAYIPLDTLRIVDISEPFSPTEVISLPIQPTAVALRGQYAYVNSSLIDIVDISNPRSPSIVSSSALIPTPQQGCDIAIADHYLYERQYDIVYILDLSNPISLTFVSSYTIGYEPYYASRGALAVSNHYAYVAVGESLYVLDVSNPSQITMTGQYTAPYLITSLAVAEPYVHVVADDLHTVDVSDPTRPVEVASHGGISANGLAVADGNILTAGYWSGLSIFRVMTRQTFLPLMWK